MYFSLSTEMIIINGMKKINKDDIIKEALDYYIYNNAEMKDIHEKFNLNKRDTDKVFFRQKRQDYIVKYYIDNDITTEECADIFKIPHQKLRSYLRGIPRRKIRKGKLVKGCKKFGIDSKIKTPTYGSYRSMYRRCMYEKDKDYPYYGGRGIKICDRWLEIPNGYFNFKEDMGERPEGHTLDRIDFNGDYEPSNCRWATIEEQTSNREYGRSLVHRSSKKLNNPDNKKGLLYRKTISKLNKINNWFVDYKNLNDEVITYRVNTYYLEDKTKRDLWISLLLEHENKEVLFRVNDEKLFLNHPCVNLLKVKNKSGNWTLDYTQ